jgi:hypothetical protein
VTRKEKIIYKFSLLPDKMQVVMELEIKITGKSDIKNYKIRFVINIKKQQKMSY